jgi:hypothetical protein
MTAKSLPSKKELQRIFSLDALTGQLTRRARADVPLWINTRFANQPAGGIKPNGYVYVSIDYEYFLAHRVIWKMIFNQEPDEIDHRNGIRHDNRLENLRPATKTLNRANSARKGKMLRGVSLLPSGRYSASISIAHKTTHLGVFDSEQAAHAAFVWAARNLHGEFARTD